MSADAQSDDWTVVKKSKAVIKQKKQIKQPSSQPNPHMPRKEFSKYKPIDPNGDVGTGNHMNLNMIDVGQQEREKQQSPSTCNPIPDNTSQVLNENITIQVPDSINDNLVVVDGESNEHTNDSIQEPAGDDIKLHDKYIFWVHDTQNKDWSLESYIKLCEIVTVSDFWRLFNNLNKIGPSINNFFMMKEGIDPIWEHVANRDGGFCSFKVGSHQATDVYTDLATHIVCQKICLKMDDINGISISPKNNWSIIKIWNRDKTHDLSVSLNEYVRGKYAGLSIKYIQNEPEY